MMKRLFLTQVLLLLTACQTQQGARVGEASSGGGSAFSGQGIDCTWHGSGKPGALPEAAAPLQALYGYQ